MVYILAYEGLQYPIRSIGSVASMVLTRVLGLQYSIASMERVASRVLT
jgi:hypothetical protein